MATDKEINRMLALADKVGDVLQDEKLLDIMSVCTLVIGFSILDQYDSKEARAKATNAVHEHLRLFVESGGIKRY